MDGSGLGLCCTFLALCWQSTAAHTRRLKNPLALFYRLALNQKEFIIYYFEAVSLWKQQNPCPFIPWFIPAGFLLWVELAEEGDVRSAVSLLQKDKPLMFHLNWPRIQDNEPVRATGGN